MVFLISLALALVLVFTCSKALRSRPVVFYLIFAAIALTVVVCTFANVRFPAWFSTWIWPIFARGAKPDGTPWRVAVQDSLGEGLLCALEIENKAVITSGGYERYFVEDGVTYWHILDPKTGAPAHSGLVSVTIVGENGLVCDGLSTALFVMDLEDAAALWRESGDFEAIFVTEDKQVYITEGIADICTLLGDYTQTSAQVIRRG